MPDAMRRDNKVVEFDKAKIKTKNIIDMAIGFTAMTRVFEKRSVIKIKDKLESVLPEICCATSEDDFRIHHHNFCRWFSQNVKTAERKKGGLIIKNSTSASYGQGAKVLDVVLKVFVHYCHLPSPEATEKIQKWLNAAVDTKMLKYLKAMPGAEASLVPATTVEQVDENTYVILQRLVWSDINERFAGSILPVEWDDIIWRQLNRQTEMKPSPIAGAV